MRSIAGVRTQPFLCTRCLYWAATLAHPIGTITCCHHKGVIEMFLLDKTHPDWREEMFLLVALVGEAIPSLLPVSVLR
jgi:hypothetical protein